MIPMNDHDPAFLWETEALRSSPQRVTETEMDDAADTAGKWATLREASRATGIPVETLRKWARRSTIPSYLTPTSGGTNIRMVNLDGVARRAIELGRAIGPAGEQSSPESASPTVPSSGVRPEPAAPAEPSVVPAGTMIVPIDAWNKMLNQLGNLHEAGQQLAVARERAAKAETEAKFLRDRLAELRRTQDRSAAAPQTSPAAANLPSEAPAATERAPAPPEKVWQYLVRRFRDRRLG